MLNIFVNTWGNYNTNGADGGEWITLPMESEELTETLTRIAGAMKDNDPEWFINDYEFTCEFEFPVEENTNIMELNDIINDLYILDENDIEKLCAICEYDSSNLNDISALLESLDNYEFYANMDLEDVAEMIVEDCYDLPEIAQRYFDYKAFARDLSFDGYYETKWGVIRYN